MKTILLKKTGALLLGTLLCSVGIMSQTLKHSYTFEDGTWSGTTLYDQVSSGQVNGTINGNDWEIKNGCFINHNSNYNAGATWGQGGYVSFDFNSLGLNQYSSLIYEAYLTTNADQNLPNKWTNLAYVGNTSYKKSFFLQPEIGGTNSKCNFNNTVAAIGAEPGANETHHYIAVLVPSTASTVGGVRLYIDGALAQSTVLAANDTTNMSAISHLGYGTAVAYIGKGPGTDALWTQPLHEFNIYDGAGADSATIATWAASRFASINTKLATLSSTVGTLYPAFNANVLNYSLLLPIGTTSFDIAATAVESGLTVNGTGTVNVGSAENGVVVLKASTPGSVVYNIRWAKDVTNASLTHSYKFTDGTASDDIGTANGSIVGSNASIANGALTLSVAGTEPAGTISYLNLPSTDLALNTYPCITAEAFIKATTIAGYISYFGNATKSAGTDYLYFHTGSTKISCNINHQPYRAEIAAAGTSLIDSKVHHVVAILKMDSIVLYQDGVKKASTALGTNNNNRIVNLSVAKAFLGRSGYYGDANWVGSIGEFNIYKGRLPEGAIVARSADFLKDATLSSISLSVGNLSFNSSSTLYNVTIPAGTASVVVGATASKDFASVTGTGTVTMDGTGFGTTSIIVTSPDGTVQKTYTVNLSTSLYTATVDNQINKLQAYCNNNKLVVSTQDDFAIYNMQGVKVGQRTNSNSVNRFELTSGVYFVKSNSHFVKVIIK